MIFLKKAKERNALSPSSGNVDKSHFGGEAKGVDRNGFGEGKNRSCVS